jgi:hypothetical protein
MFVLATFSAVPVVVVSVFTTAVPIAQSFVAHTFTVPPPVALNAPLVPELTVMPPENVAVPPPRGLRWMPVQLVLQVIPPLAVPFSSTVPPVRFRTSTARPLLVLLMLPL